MLHRSSSQGERRIFVFSFLAHGLGTLVGAWVAAMLTVGRTSDSAYVVGSAFQLGGVANVLMLPAALWFSALDLVAAYLPAAWLGHRLASRNVAKAANGV